MKNTREKNTKVCEMLPVCEAQIEAECNITFMG
jgi:hypothetical protein